MLFCRERDPERELWDGLRAGQDGAISEYGADDAFPIGDIDDILPGLIEGRERVYYSIGTNPEFDQHLMEWVNVIRSKARQGAQPPNEVRRPRPPAARHAPVQVGGRDQGHARGRRGLRPRPRARHAAARAGLYEYSLEAELEYEFRKGGAKMPAYGSIVAAGKNACILHYRENDALLRTVTWC